MARLSPLGKSYQQRYIHFSKQMHNAWMHYAIQPKLGEIVEEFCSREDGSSIILERMSPINPDGGRQPSRIPVHNLAGMMRRYYKREVPESVFINSISLFEALVSDVAKVAYLNNPSEYLLQRHQKEDNSSDRENLKLLRIVIESRDRKSVIEQYVDNLLKGVFYGNPVELFTKNRLRFNIHKTLTAELRAELVLYGEMTARRNVIVHNMSIADKKYVEESKGSQFTVDVGDLVVISDAYLYTTILTLNAIAKRYVDLVLRQTTGEAL